VPPGRGWAAAAKQGGAPSPSPRSSKGKGLDEVARRALLSLVTLPQLYLDRCVVGAGVDRGQARVKRFVVIAPCPRRHPQPNAVPLIDSCWF
jgi:hypothetical protein